MACTASDAARTGSTRRKTPSEQANNLGEDLGQFTVQLASLSIAALITTTRDTDRRTALQVIATTAVAATAIGAAVAAIL